MSVSSLRANYEVDGDVVLYCKGVWKIFRAGDGVIKALRDVSLAVQKGELLCVRGPSGSGKSTLLNILGTLDSPTTGEVVGLEMRYQDLSQFQMSRFRRNYLGFVFQELSLIPHLTALENVLMPCLFDPGADEVVARFAVKLLQDVGAYHRASHFPRQLSSGERQRVAIARSLVRNPRIVFADEPTANLDNANVEKVISIFKGLCNQGVTIVVATHDERIERASARTIWIDDGVLSDRPIG